MPDIVISAENSLSAEEFYSILERSGLAERRPVDSPERIAAMAANGNLIITARDGGRMIGVSRSVTDFAYCCYCPIWRWTVLFRGKASGGGSWRPRKPPCIRKQRCI